MSVWKPAVAVFALFLATAPISTAQEPAPATEPQDSTEAREQIQALRDLTTSLSDLMNELRARDRPALELSKVAAGLDERLAELVKATEEIASERSQGLVTIILAVLPVIVMFFTWRVTHNASKKQTETLREDNKRLLQHNEILHNEQIAADDVRKVLELNFFARSNASERAELRHATIHTVRLALAILAVRANYFKTQVENLSNDNNIDLKEIVKLKIDAIDEHLLNNLHRHLNVLESGVGNKVVIAIYAYQTLADFLDFARRALATNITIQNLGFENPNELLEDLKNSALVVDRSLQFARSMLK